MVDLPAEIWIVIGEWAAFVYGELETNVGDPFAAPPQFDIAVGIQKAIPTRRSLVLVSRAFYTAFTSLLYRSIVLEDAKSLSRLAETLKGQRSLDVSQRNGRWSRRLVLITRRERHWRDLPAIEARDLLKDLPRLQILGIRGRLDSSLSFPFDLGHPCRELTVLHASHFGIMLPNYIHSPTAFSDAFPNLRHSVIRNIFSPSDPPHYVNPIDPSLGFLHCSTESIKPFLGKAHAFSLLTITGLTVTSIIDNWSSSEELIARKLTTLDFSVARRYASRVMLTWAATCASIETLVIDVHTYRFGTALPAFSNLRHLGLVSALRQISRSGLDYTFDGLYKHQQRILPRLENIRLLQPSFSTHVVQRFPGRVVEWTDRFSSKGVRLENYEGDPLSSGIKLGGSAFARRVWTRS